MLDLLALVLIWKNNAYILMGQAPWFVVKHSTTIYGEVRTDQMYVWKGHTSGKCLLRVIEGILIQIIQNSETWKDTLQMLRDTGCGISIYENKGC